MDADVDSSLIPSNLTDAEENFVHNLEVLGMPLQAAAAMAGVPIRLARAPHIIQARDLLKNDLRGSVAFTREDIVHGIHDAVGRAKILDEPMTEIAGWKEISKLLGHDAPTKIDVNITSSKEVVQEQIRNLPDSALTKMLGAGDVIDAEFYDVRK